MMISIRQCVKDDVPVLVALGIQTFKETFEEVNTSENMNLYLSGSFTHDRVSEELEETGAVFFIAEAESEPVGYAKVRTSRRPDELNNTRAIEIERLYVKKSSIGKGIGKMLMENCLTHARQDGYEVVWLGVWEHNVRAIRFYTHWGFKKFGQHVFMLGNDVQTDYLFSKELN